MIHNILSESAAGFGDGLNVRDWLHVKDHSRRETGRSGSSGGVYNIGGITNGAI